MWLLIKQCTSLRQAGRPHRCKGQCMQRAIHAVLKMDRMVQMAQVTESIITELTKGNMHKAFCHLKGLYWAATETQAWPCFQTIKKQTAECIHLYQRCESLGLPVAINVASVEDQDNVPTNGEIRAAVAKLTNGRSAGVSCMWAEHLKEWLWGVNLEEDPETGPNNVAREINGGP
jgi:hypothetical protein